MNQKEIGELRRRIAVDKCCINKIYGRFINKKKEVISEIETSVGMMTQTEKEKFLTVFRKVLSGGRGKNLHDICFTTKQVAGSPEHKLLMDLRASALKDEAVRNEMLDKIVENLNMPEENYLILLTYDTYDVPKKGTDGIKQDDSETVFSYILCCVCPVKDAKAELGYNSEDKEFHSLVFPQTVAAPELGFMFPSFDDRRANIYNASYYSKNAAEIHEELIDAIFCIEPPMPAPEQKEVFSDVLTQALDNDCSFEVVQAVHEQICERIELHKESKDPDPLVISSYDMGKMLEGNGIAEEKVQVFCEKYDEEFGENADINPDNIINSKKFEVETPQVKITVSPEYSCLVETKVINGRKYILIPADDGAVINGINVTIKRAALPPT